MAKVIRVLIYEGSPEWVTNTLENAGVPINGVYNLNNSCSIRSTIAQAFTKCKTCSNLTNNKTLICDDCTTEAVKLAKEYTND